MSIKYEYDCGGRCKYFNCKCQLKKYSTGDCTIRAISIATKMDYKVVWDSMMDSAKETGWMPNSRENCELFLESIGWKRQKPFRKGRKKYKLKNVPIDNNTRYIFHTSKHWTAVVDGICRDTWDCREWCANSYWIKVN